MEDGSSVPTNRILVIFFHIVMPDGSSQTCRVSIMHWARFHWEALAPAIQVVCYFGTYHLSTQTKHTNLDATFWRRCPYLNNFYSLLQMHCFSSYLASVLATQQPQVFDGSHQTDSEKARHQRINTVVFKKATSVF